MWEIETSRLGIDSANALAKLVFPAPDGAARIINWPSDPDPRLESIKFNAPAVNNS